MMMTTTKTTSMMMKIKETYLVNLQPAQVGACVGRGLFSAKLSMTMIFIYEDDFLLMMMSQTRQLAHIVALFKT